MDLRGEPTVESVIFKRTNKTPLPFGNRLLDHGRPLSWVACAHLRSSQFVLAGDVIENSHLLDSKHSLHYERVDSAIIKR